MHGLRSSIIGLFNFPFKSQCFGKFLFSFSFSFSFSYQLTSFFILYSFIQFVIVYFFHLSSSPLFASFLFLSLTAVNIHKNHSARIRSRKAGPSISCLLLSPSLKKPNPDSTLIPLDVLPVKMPRSKLRTLPGPLLPAVVVSSPIMSENESLESYSSVV